jgi:hypothetical protein
MFVSSSSEITHFIFIKQPRIRLTCLVYNWLKLKSSLLKVQVQMIFNLVQRMNVRRPSTKIFHSILIQQKTWFHMNIFFLIDWILKHFKTKVQMMWAALVSDWLKFKKSSHLKLGGTMNCYIVGMMYSHTNPLQNFHISCHHTTNMAVIGSSCLWLTNYKNSSLKSFGQINWNSVGSTYGSFHIKFPQNKMTDEQHRLCPLSL